MTDELIIFFPPDNQTLLGPLANKRSLRTAREVARVYCQRSALRCLAFDSVELVRTVAHLGARRRHKLLLLEPFDEQDVAARARLRVLRSLFVEVIRPEPALNFLEPSDLAAALGAQNASDLAIAVSHDPATESIYILRANLDTLIIPSAALTTYGDGPRPDLARLRIEDCGQTLQAGNYESSMDALLYEYDRAYRRKLKTKRRAEEQSLGASLRRLRLQKGLRQSDFSGISMKEVARIERGEVKTPRAETLHKFAERLGVTVDDLPEF